jgi:hypothetical protein
MGQRIVAAFGEIQLLRRLPAPSKWSVLPES